MSNERYEDDYGIIFPQSNLNGMPRPPVVFLFGWGGCIDRYLVKYAEMYSAIGCITIRYCSPVDYTFWRPHMLSKIAQTLHNLLDEEEMDLGTHPLFVHMLSGGGCFVFNALQAHINEQAFKGRPESFRFSGLILDSAPPTGYVLNRSMAYCHIKYRNSLQSFWYPVMPYLYCVIFKIYDWSYYIYNLFVGKSIPSWLPTTLGSRLTSFPACPMLFLYSDADKLCPSNRIEAYMKEEAERECDVRGENFGDSEHVQHYRRYPVRYQSVILKFLDFVLNSSE